MSGDGLSLAAGVACAGRESRRPSTTRIRTPAGAGRARPATARARASPITASTRTTATITRIRRSRTLRAAASRAAARDAARVDGLSRVGVRSEVRRGPPACRPEGTSPSSGPRSSAWRRCPDRRRVSATSWDGGSRTMAPSLSSTVGTPRSSESASRHERLTEGTVCGRPAWCVRTAATAAGSAAGEGCSTGATLWRDCDRLLDRGSRSRTQQAPRRPAGSPRRPEPRHSRTQRRAS